MILADKLRHNISFRMMALQFHLRDISEPPERILAEIGIMQGMTVLDFGCGPGSFSLAAARLTGHMGKVYAMDIDVHAINCVDKAAKHHGVENIQIINGETMGDIPTGTVDVVVMYDVLHQISIPSQILVEIYRVLKLRGIPSVGDHHLGEEALLNTVTKDGLFRLSNQIRHYYQFVGVQNEGAHLCSIK